MNPSTRCALLLVLCLIPVAASGVERLSFTLGSLDAPGLQLRDLALVLIPKPGGRAGLELSIGRLQASALGTDSASARLSCPFVTFDNGEVACAKGNLQLDHPWMRGKTISASVRWNPWREQLKLSLQGLSLAGGHWSLQAFLAHERWNLQIQSKKTDLAQLQELALNLDLPQRIGVLEGQGALDLRVEGRAEGALQGRWTLGLKDLVFSDPTDQYLADGLKAALNGRFQRHAHGGLTLEADLDLQAGALLTPFAYLEPGPDPVRLSLALERDARGRHITLKRFEYRHAQVLDLDVKAQIQLQPFQLKELQLQTQDFSVDTLYRRYFQPLLAETLLQQVAFDGKARLQLIKPEKGALRLQADLQDLGLVEVPAEPEGLPKFTIQDLSGQVHWSEQAGPATRLELRSAQLLGALDIGQTTLRAQLQGRSVRLLQTLRLPLFDGELIVDHLALRTPAEQALELEFDGILTPVSMERLSEAFGWPPLQGSLSGVIPDLALREGRLTLDGNLLIRAFNGHILIRKLVLGDLLGVLPTLRADVELRGLDLETLTGAFSFGKITGALEGRVKDLYMEDWQPIAFDAVLRTPVGEDSTHFISQRAVDNISNLGGAGIAGALSRSFLGMFEEFRYARLGISCKLADGVCRMGGIEPAEQGYYLVVGSGIPQINIKGFNTHTDWDRLVRQLGQISTGGSPVIE